MAPQTAATLLAKHPKLDLIIAIGTKDSSIQIHDVDSGEVSITRVSIIPSPFTYMS
jgi:hypothetical protein